jgi:lysophospholipase L1-like esterase
LCTYEHGSQLNEAIAWIKNKDLSLVTIDIGANDALACLRLPEPSQPQCLADAFTSVATNLTAILTTLRQAVGPDVPIIGMNYYNPLIAQWLHGTENGRLAAIESQKSIVAPFNDLLEAVYLSSQLANAVADVESAFASADFTSDAPTMVESSLGVPIPLSVANICAYTWMCSAGDIHANTAGYRLIAETFLSAMR